MELVDYSLVVTELGLVGRIIAVVVDGRDVDSPPPGHRGEGGIVHVGGVLD